MRVRTLTRKSFLRALAALGILGTGAFGGGCGSGDEGGGSPPPPDGARLQAFKLSTRGRHGCNACTHHARFKLFQTSAAADAHRAHAGCDCAVKAVMISAADAATYFAQGPIYDRRSSG